MGESHRWGATYAYYCVLGGVFVTALYTFRMIFMTFHGPERFRHPEHGRRPMTGDDDMREMGTATTITATSTLPSRTRVRRS